MIDAIMYIKSNINIDNISTRDIYDDTMKFKHIDNIEISEQEIQRMMVNNIRHSHSNYEKSLKVLRKMDRDSYGVNYKIYKNAVLHEISKMYPALSNECTRQQYDIKMIRNI